MTGSSSSSEILRMSKMGVEELTIDDTLAATGTDVYLSGV